MRVTEEELMEVAALIRRYL